MVRKKQARERRAPVSEALERALRIIAAHDAFQVSSSTLDPQSGDTVVEVVIRLGLPNAWMADGTSPKGVRVYEPVTLILPASFPLESPKILLRGDFDRSLAHVNPGTPGERPVPCIYDGRLLELLQHQGLPGILNQLVLWLENAALGRLIDPEQGWEIVRRDNLEDVIVADAAYLRSLVSPQEGSRIFGFGYLRQGVNFYGEVGRDFLPLSPKTVGNLFTEERLSKKHDIAVGRSMAIFVWPGKQPSGQPFVSDRYLPETVINLSSLRERAEGYGCARPLRTALELLQRCAATYTANRTCPIAIILCARRLFHIAGSNSPLELCPYLVEISAPRLFPEDDEAPVRPAGHRHVITASLLRSMSGSDPEGEAPSWVQLGAGSLGSKIALHLAREGRAPRIVIDGANLSPHNAARHALVPTPGGMQISWIGPKAVALAKVIEGLGQTAEAYVGDVLVVTRDVERAKRLLPKRSWAVVNSTAALSVREALASVPTGIIIPRVIETSLYAGGRVGLLSVEGPDRNPNTGDLIAETYSLMSENAAVRGLVFTGSDALQVQAIGEGCGSVTMVMSDARISTMAAPMAETLTTMQRTGLPAGGGRILLGILAEDDLSQSWHRHEVAPWVPVNVDRAPNWHVRIADRAHRKIMDEVARWPGVETGGILVGRFSEAAQTFYVIDVMPAPEDSRRSAVEFVLGTEGARASLKDFSERSAYNLYCLGTWHSHLFASGPSATDHATAVTVALARLMPSVLLIHTPVGYRAVLAEPPASSGPVAPISLGGASAPSSPPQAEMNPDG